MRKSEAAITRCKTISTIQKLLGGKYKIEIPWYIGKCDIRRFGQLRRQIGEITDSSLTKQLRELEADGFLNRHDFCEVPPRVEYTLTELGTSFLEVLDHMKAWGDENLSISYNEGYRDEPTIWWEFERVCMLLRYWLMIFVFVNERLKKLTNTDLSKCLK